jgi:membrane-associated phospholipid phosphatase
MAVPFACWAVISALGHFPGDVLMRPWMGNRPNWLLAHHVPGVVTAATDALAALGTPLLAVVAVAVIAYAGFRQDGRRGAALAFAAVLVIFLSDALKALFGPSSLQAATTPEPHPVGTLPSTHAAYAAAVFGYGALIAWRAGRRRLAVAIGVVIALMGPTRMLQAAHWPSDVLAGYALGFGWLAGLVALASWAPEARRSRYPVTSSRSLRSKT